MSNLQAIEFVAPPEAVPLSETAAIVGEIAARLVELEDTQHGLGADLVFRLAQLNNLSPDSFRTTCELLSGDTENARKSFGEHERETGMRKQNFFYRWKMQVSRIEAVFPEVAQAMRDQRDYLRVKSDPVKFHEMMHDVIEHGQHGPN